MFFTITLSDSAADQNRRDPPTPLFFHNQQPCLSAGHDTGKQESAGLVSFPCPFTIPICQKCHEACYQVQVCWTPLGLNILFCSPWMQDRVICLSQGAGILLHKQTFVYNWGPAGADWRCTHGLKTTAIGSTDLISGFSFI